MTLSTSIKRRFAIAGATLAALGFATFANGAQGNTVEAAEVDYTVEQGDTLFKIAEKHLGNGWDYHNIADANGIENPNLILVGQTLTLDINEETNELGSVKPAEPAKQVSAQEEQPEPQKSVVQEEEKEETQDQVKGVHAKEQTPASTSSTQGVPEYVMQVVESEAGPSYQEKANVFSVIVNRVNSGVWGGNDYMSVVNAPGQFQVTWTGMADSTSVSNQTRQAVSDVLANGVTTGADSFHASGDGVTNVFH